MWKVHSAVLHADCKAEGFFRNAWVLEIQSILTWRQKLWSLSFLNTLAFQCFSFHTPDICNLISWIKVLWFSGGHQALVLLSKYIQREWRDADAEQKYEETSDTNFI